MLEALTGYDVVLVSEFSRLTRTATRGSEILQRLKEAGARLVIASEGGPVYETSRDEEGGTAFERLVDVVAEMEREALVRRLQAGRAVGRAGRGGQR